VTNREGSKRRQQPVYSVKKVQELALAHRVNYGSRRVMNDVDNLGYSMSLSR
jgi:hypothetical protein